MRLPHISTLSLMALTANQFYRTSAVRECNSVLTTVTTNDLHLLVDATADALNLSDESTQVFSDNIQYDVLVSKVCGVCDYDDNVAACTQYGNDATLSSVALHPLQQQHTATGSSSEMVVVSKQDIPTTILSANLQGFVAYRGIYADAREQAFSEYFPKNFTQAILDNPWTHDIVNATTTVVGDGYKLFNSLLAPLLAASSGAIAILVDDVGTGESLHTVDRSFLAAVPVQQATTVAWRAVQNYTESISQGCTVLDNVTSMAGYSAGAYKVMIGADALHSLGVEILQVLPAGGVYDAGNAALVGLAASLAQGIAVSPEAFISYSFYVASYSNPNATYLPNIVQGKPMASPLWLQRGNPRQNILDWWMGPTAWTFDEQVAFQPMDSIQQASIFDPYLFNQTLSAALAGPIPTCDPSLHSNETASLCQAIHENSAYPYFALAPYPVEWCHSPDDTTVPYIFTQLIPPNAFGMVQQYEPITEDLTPRGSHAMADNLCSGAIAAYFQRSQGVFNKMTPTRTTTNDNGHCGAPLLVAVEPNKSGTTSAEKMGNGQTNIAHDEEEQEAVSSSSSSRGMVLGLGWLHIAAAAAMISSLWV